MEVISRIRLGERDAYAELVRKYQTKVRGYCFHMLSNWALAEEAAQDVFLKAFQSLDRFRGDASFSTWLYRITANHCTDLLRKSAKQKWESLEQLIERDGDKIRALFAVGPSAVVALEHRDLVKKILAQLKPEYREVLILRELQGLSYKEMADVLDCSLDATKARLKRARQEVQDKFGHFFQELNVETSRKGA